MNSNCDDVTIGPDNDLVSGKTAFLPFESSDLMLAGIRLLPAQLARCLGVSKQAVSTWVKSGRVILGSDGRVDPAKAIDRLLATGNPDRLRIKMLAPLQKEVAARDCRINDLEVAVAVRDRRIAEIEAAIAKAQDEADFHEQSAAGFVEMFDQLQTRLADSWEMLRQAPPDVGRNAILAWMNHALSLGAADAGEIANHMGAPDDDHGDRSPS